MVIVAGTLDTKGEELRFIRDLLKQNDVRTRLVDLSTSGKHSAADVAPLEIALNHPRGSAGVFGSDRGASVAAMAEAFEAWMARQSGIAGMISAGGSGATSLVTPAMRRLPVGVPKIMISTVASGDVGRYVGPADIMMMYSVTDVQGINAISRQILANGAQAMAGMVKARLAATREARTSRAAQAELPAIGLTMFGVTTPCVQQLTAALAGEYDCLVFHATGVGGQSMEKLVDGGQLEGVIDITTTEVCDLMMGGVFPATEDRFGAIIRARMPYVGSVGALDMVNFGPRDTVPERYRHRLLHQHNPQVTLMRTTPDENEQMGRWIGERLNQMDAPVRFLLPEGGVSALGQGGRRLLRSGRGRGAVPRARTDRAADLDATARARAGAHQRCGIRCGGARRLPRGAWRAHRAPQGGEVAMRFERSALMEKFRAMVARGEPIVGGGAGTGLSAKCEEAGGIDLIVIYNSGRYRMAGRGSLAGLMAYGDANAIVMEMAAEVLPVVKHTPVLAGVNGTDPFRADGRVPRPGEGDRLLRRAELPDRRHHRRHLPRQPRRDRHVLRARGRHDRQGAREGHADHALRLQRGRSRRDGEGRRRHHRVPHGADHRRRDRRRDRAQARRLPGAGRMPGPTPR